MFLVFTHKDVNPVSESLLSGHHSVLIASFGVLSSTASAPELGLQHHHIASCFLAERELV